MRSPSAPADQTPGCCSGACTPSEACELGRGHQAHRDAIARTPRARRQPGKGHQKGRRCMSFVESSPAAWPALGPQPGVRDTAGQQGTHMASSPSSFSKSPRYDCQAVGAVSGAESSTRLAATASTSTCRVRTHSRGQGCRAACCSCLPPQPCCPEKAALLPARRMPRCLCAPAPAVDRTCRAGAPAPAPTPARCPCASGDGSTAPQAARNRTSEVSGRTGAPAPCARQQNRSVAGPAAVGARAQGAAIYRGCLLKAAWNVKLRCVQPSPTEPAADVYLGNPPLPCRLWAACT